MDRRDTAEAGEGGLALQPLGMVSDHGQQRRSVVGDYAWQGNQLRDGFRHQPIELHVQLGVSSSSSRPQTGFSVEELCPPQAKETDESADARVGVEPGGR